MVLDYQGVKKRLAITIVLHLIATIILAVFFPSIMIGMFAWGIVDDVIWLVRLRYPYTIASRPLIYVQILVTISNFLYTSYNFGFLAAVFASICLDNNITQACDSFAIGIILYLIIADILLLCMVYFFFRILQFALQIPAPAIVIPGQDQQPPSQQPGYPQQDNTLPAYSQTGYSQQAYPQQAYPQQAYPQQAYPHQSYPQQGFSQQAYPQQAYPQQANSQQAYPQYAYPQQGYSQQSYPQQVYYQQGYPAQAHLQKGSPEQKALP